MRYDHLDAPQRAVARMASSPGLAVAVATCSAAMLAWTWLVAGAVSIADLEPISAVARQNAWLESTGWSRPDWIPTAVWQGLARLCTPLESTAWGSTLLASFLMWSAMSVAMMLPSAAPMLRTYADIADTAAQRGQDARSTLWLASGYLTAWLAFAFAAAILQTGAVVGGLLTASDARLPLATGGLVLLGAGLYQFTPLKEACLRKCRNPFATLFGRWTTTRSGVFRLGVDQGVWCLGCCWALMLIMLAVGVMNLAWMAVLAVVTLLEKTGKRTAMVRGTGFLLCAWGLGLCATALAIGA